MSWMRSFDLSVVSPYYSVCGTGPCAGRKRLMAWSVFCLSERECTFCSTAGCENYAATCADRGPTIYIIIALTTRLSDCVTSSAPWSTRLVTSEGSFSEVSLKRRVKLDRQPIRIVVYTGLYCSYGTNSFHNYNLSHPSWLIVLLSLDEMPNPRLLLHRHPLEHHSAGSHLQLRLLPLLRHRRGPMRPLSPSCELRQRHHPSSSHGA